jgi:hypothetical protein
MRAFLIALSLAFASTAIAQTREEAAACYNDAVRFCGVKRGAPEPDAMERARIKLCMLWHRTEVSPRCRRVFEAHGL